MPRKPVRADTQTTVLVRSRRRCCICYGLNRDTGLKVGQIAHLDRDNSNSAEDNLAFLCFEHHDEFDSRTSQRKGLTPGEVKQFREELHRAIDRAFSMEVHFGAITLPKKDPYAGQFIRIGGADASAELKLTPLEDGAEGAPRYAVTGFALWGTSREYGPNMGELEFVGTLINGKIEHSYKPAWQNECHSISLAFEGDGLVVEEQNWLGIYGMNVNFIGEYRRT